VGKIKFPHLVWGEQRDCTSTSTSLAHLLLFLLVLSTSSFSWEKVVIAGRNEVERGVSVTSVFDGADESDQVRPRGK